MYRILCESPTYPLYWLLCVLPMLVRHAHSGSISVYTCPISFNFKDIFVIFVSRNHCRCAILISLIGFLKLCLSEVLIGKFIRSSIVNANGNSLANTKKISKQKLKKLANMKTLKDLFELIAKAVSENGTKHNTWFFRFSGHVNHLGIDHHTIFELGGHKNSCDIYLTEDGIQEAYWFIKNRLKK